MNEEELQWLKEISTTTGISYSGDMTITTDFANKLIDYIKELEQLQNNWNELKKWLGTRINTDKDYERNSHIKEKLQVEDYVIKQVMFFMQELEQVKD